MKRFNKLFEEGLTKVRIGSLWYVVRYVHPTRRWVEVYGLIGSFQRVHISGFTNRVAA